VWLSGDIAYVGLHRAADTRSVLGFNSCSSTPASRNLAIRHAANVPPAIFDFQLARSHGCSNDESPGQCDHGNDGMFSAAQRFNPINLNR
jgi:hypothetical protein